MSCPTCLGVRTCSDSCPENPNYSSCPHCEAEVRMDLSEEDHAPDCFAVCADCGARVPGPEFDEHFRECQEEQADRLRDMARDGEFEPSPPTDTAVGAGRGAGGGMENPSKG